MKKKNSCRLARRDLYPSYFVPLTYGYEGQPVQENIRIFITEF